MKKLFTLTLFLCAASWAYAQYNHVQIGPNGNKTEEGQYNMNPGIDPGDSKETIANKMAAVHKVGNWKYWFENEQLAAEEHYDVNGNPSGIWKTWHQNGQLASELNYTAGTAVYYHPNGQKAEEGHINTGQQRVGAWQGWHENGNLNYTGTYNTSGQKNGDWKYYDANGTLETTQKFVNDVLQN